MLTRTLAVILLSMAACTAEALQPSIPATGATAKDTILTLTNAAREQSGARPLARDPRLDEVAQAHARDMAVRQYFSHTSPDGKTPFQRLQDAKVSYRTAGENIAGNHSAAAAVEGWLNSEGHRRNMLNPDFGRLGVGIHREASSPYTYYVQVFTN